MAIDPETVEGLAADIDYLRKRNADLEAEIEKLKNALRPFASLAAHYPAKRKYGNRPTTGTLHQVSSAGLPDGEFTIEDIHRAADLIEKQIT